MTTPETDNATMSDEARAMERLYEEDYFLWTIKQAAQLRWLAERATNLPLDLGHLAEEVEDLGKAERNAVRSHTRIIIEHLLKLEYSRSAEPRSGWKRPIAAARVALGYSLTPSLTNELLRTWEQNYKDAASIAKYSLEQHEGATTQLPSHSPYTFDEIRMPDWFPENRHGLGR